MTHQPVATDPALDGRHDFDFLFGDWLIANRKLRDPLADGGTEWVAFEASGTARPIVGGLGNVDSFVAPEFPGRGAFEGFSLRLFEETTGLWRIWWASTAGGGRLDPPVIGRFVDGVGHFEGDDTLAGRPVKVRFEWTAITAKSARWAQAFSFDGGATFVPNWVMDFTRHPR
jgi:hypothetical protein